MEVCSEGKLKYNKKNVLTKKIGLKLVIIAILQLVIFIAVGLTIEVHASSFLKGVVLDGGDLPLEGAKVSVWLGGGNIASGFTGSDGVFEIEVVSNTSYVIYVFADKEETPGVDYLPSRSEAKPSDDLKFTLQEAASMIINGDVQFVDSKDLPVSIVFKIMNLTSNQVMNVSGFPLIYGYGASNQNQFLNLEPTHLMAPADTPFTIMVNSSILIGSELVHRSFEIDQADHFVLKNGEMASIDVRIYSIPINFELVDELQQEVDSKLTEMESMGFYLAKEMSSFTSTIKQVSEARYLYEEGKFIESFGETKKSHISIIQIKSDLASLYNDASFSVYILIFLLAFSSTSIAFLLSNKDVTKVISTFVVYAAMLFILYYLYPGSSIITSEIYYGLSVIAFTSSLAIAMVFPRLMRGRGRGGHVPVRNIVVPIFSIAKRDIKRRRLRFAFTLTSISVLVMSFVALTSFSEGYGLITNRVLGNTLPVKGVLLRASGYTETLPIFITQTDVDSDWLYRQPETGIVSLKAENLPLPQPITSLDGAPIFGVIGIDPELESVIIDLKGIIIDGELPSEGSLMISNSLREKLGVKIGDELMLGEIELVLKGIINDDMFYQLKDIDGKHYLPKKLVDISTEEEPPKFEADLCDPSEVVIVDLSTATQIPLVGVARLGLSVTEDVKIHSFAERLALERGYLAWSSSIDGVFLSQLGSYFEGKGLPLFVPWAIVVLNVVVTMLNSLYERRREVHILSSVGLNPAQISAIFVAEATILGIISGGAGYLAGLGFYKGLSLFQLAVEVRQKVSAFWSLAAIGISMVSVLIGALVSLKSSVIITPSLMRKWKISEERMDLFKPLEVPIPVKLLPEEVEGFVEFMFNALKARENDPDRITSSIRISSEEREPVKIDFIYRARQATVGNFYTKNSLNIERGLNEATVKLNSDGDPGWVHATGSMIRMLVVEWSTLRGKKGESFRS